MSECSKARCDYRALAAPTETTIAVRWLVAMQWLVFLGLLIAITVDCGLLIAIMVDCGLLIAIMVD